MSVSAEQTLISDAQASTIATDINEQLLATASEQRTAQDAFRHLMTLIASSLRAADLPTTPHNIQRVRDALGTGLRWVKEAPQPPKPNQGKPALQSMNVALSDAELNFEAKASYLVWGNEVDQPVLDRDAIEAARDRLIPIVMERVDPMRMARLKREALNRDLRRLILELTLEFQLRLNQSEQARLVELIAHEMVGLGPLEPLLADEEVNDIMVNGTHSTYVEVRGKLKLTDVRFRNDAHILAIGKRIVSRIGRRIDETRPLVDARLHDGSRVNIIIPPLAIDGPTISIRKFSRKSITIDWLAEKGSMSPAMAQVVKVASRSRLNILISGGTGSGKTTLLNALSRQIDPGERVVTIEDAAELQLQQPHVVRLETRPPNLEGEGEITQRDLVKNSLRMRPDRIILGEVRGSEALDMLQAMNTGHDGSMATVHANRPRDAVTRLENMVTMGAGSLPTRFIRQQIASSVNLIVQVARLRDGSRRVTHVTEVVGMDGEEVLTEDLFVFDQTGEDADGKLLGEYRWTGIMPRFRQRAAHYGLERELLAALKA